MPPKKKDDKKSTDVSEAADEQKEMMETELLIGYLKSKLGRYPSFCDVASVPTASRFAAPSYCLQVQQ